MRCSLADPPEGDPRPRHSLHFSGSGHGGRGGAHGQAGAPPANDPLPPPLCPLPSLRPIVLIGSSLGGAPPCGQGARLPACLGQLGGGRRRPTENRGGAPSYGLQTPLPPFSLSLRAGRVVFHCLLELARRGRAGVVESAVLLGAAVPDDVAAWTAARGVVAGRLVNAYSGEDWLVRRGEGGRAGGGMMLPPCRLCIASSLPPSSCELKCVPPSPPSSPPPPQLGLLFRSSLSLGSAAGLKAVAAPGVENVNMASIVAAHGEWATRMPDVLEVRGEWGEGGGGVAYPVGGEAPLCDQGRVLTACALLSPS